MYILESDKELTDERLIKFLNKHQDDVNKRYRKLKDAYEGRYEIFKGRKKPSWKPDNRIAVNFAKYIVDTMNGFFIGVPIKVTTEEGNDKLTEYIEFLDGYNDMDNQNAELSKYASMFGKCYDLYYVDEESNIGITHTTPMESFMIYDDSIIGRPRYFVRTYVDTDNLLHGSVSDSKVVRYFTKPGGLKWENDGGKSHGFNGVPATEYNENEESIGTFEPVLTMINAYNKAISEKANDVDYFADAYMRVLGALVDEDTIQEIRRNRIINFEGDAQGLNIDFLQKPNGDTTQENLINRLEKLIFQTSMVANISDETFGTSSGIALKYKLLAMSNMAKTKELKFKSALSRRYKLIFSNEISHQHGVSAEDFVKLSYHFTRNYPNNILEETQIARNLEGMVDKETQLKVLSIVDNPQGVIEKMNEEVEEAQKKALAMIEQVPDEQ